MNATLSTSRSELFMGDYSERLENKKILFAGCGADGSHAADALSRFLVGRSAEMIFADPDSFSDENLGIQVLDRTDIGMNKASATANRVKLNYPSIDTVAITEGITEDNVEDLLEGVDYVVDATDISVISIANLLHAQASARGISRVVPWSLGYGGACMGFSGSSSDTNFELWGSQASQIAVQAGYPEMAFLARWLVNVPKGVDVSVIHRVMSGVIPTPTTYFGAMSGGHLAAKWIACHVRGLHVPVFPNIIQQRHRGEDLLFQDTETGDFRDFTQTSFKNLKG